MFQILQSSQHLPWWHLCTLFHSLNQLHEVVTWNAFQSSVCLSIHGKICFLNISTRWLVEKNRFFTFLVRDIPSVWCVYVICVHTCLRVSMNVFCLYVGSVNLALVCGACVVDSWPLPSSCVSLMADESIFTQGGGSHRHTQPGGHHSASTSCPVDGYLYNIFRKTWAGAHPEKSLCGGAD